jgi:hypothetical protein
MVFMQAMRVNPNNRCGAMELSVVDADVIEVSVPKIPTNLRSTRNQELSSQSQ